VAVLVLAYKQAQADLELAQATGDLTLVNLCATRFASVGRVGHALAGLTEKE
jgi:hypothetical protein